MMRQKRQQWPCPPPLRSLEVRVGTARRGCRPLGQRACFMPSHSFPEEGAQLVHLLASCSPVRLSLPQGRGADTQVVIRGECMRADHSALLC